MNSKSIEYVLEQMGVHSVSQSGEWITAPCPLAPWTHASGTDRRPSFGVKEGLGMSSAHCFSCGYSSGLLSLVQRYASYAIPEGLWTEDDKKQLCDYILLAEDSDTVARREVRVHAEGIGGLANSLGVWHEYFEKRGITKDMFDMWNLGYVESYTDPVTKATMHKRVLFPLYRKGDRLDLIGVIGRSVIDAEPKYKNMPPSLSKSAFLYGSWLAGDRRKIIVVEGPMDCIMLNRHLSENGFDEYFGVALLGSDPSVAQMCWLKDNAYEVICMLDNDPSGMLGNKKLIEGLERSLVVSVVRWKDGCKDPDEAGEHIVDMIRERKTALEYRLGKILGVF